MLQPIAIEASKGRDSKKGRSERDIRIMKRILPLTTAFLLCLGEPLFAQSPSNSRRAAWSTVAVKSQPTARHEAAMVALGGKAYLMGGRGVKAVEEFGPGTSSWRKLGPTPLEMHHFQPVALGGQVYVMTAMTGKYPKETPLESWYLYEPADDLWRKGDPIPVRRRRGGA